MKYSNFLQQPQSQPLFMFYACTMQMWRTFMKTFTSTYPASNEIGGRVELGLWKFGVNKVKLKSEKVK